MHAKLLLGLLAGVLLVGCGPSKKKPEDPDSSMGSDWDPDEQHRLTEEADSDAPEFDEEAAQNVMRRAAEQAKNCPKVAPDVPRGEGEVEVVFDGPKGIIVDVNLGPIFSGGSEQAQQCIKNAFIGQIIPPFRGTKTVPYLVTIPEK